MQSSTGLRRCIPVASQTRVEEYARSGPTTRIHMMGKVTPGGVQLGMIRSEELQSSDNIPCQRLEDSEMLIHPPSDHLDHLAGTLPRAEVTLPRMPINQEEPDPLESNGNTARRSGLEDAARHRDGTLFDKYFDQDVDKWSINQEVEI